MRNPWLRVVVGVVAAAAALGCGSKREPPSRAVDAAARRGPTTVVEQSSGILLLGVDATRIYYAVLTSEPGQVVFMSARPDGRDARELARDELHGEAFDGGDLYWTRPGYSGDRQGAVMKVAKAGGTAEVVVGGLNLPEKLVVDGEQLYFGGQGFLAEASTAGGEPHVLVSDQLPWSLALDDERVYWVNTLDASLMSLPRKPGASASTLAAAAPREHAGALDVDATTIVWSIGTSPSTGRILSITKPGGPAVTITDAAWCERYLALAPTHVYCASTTGMDQGNVIEVAREDGAVRILYTPPDGERITGLAVTDDAVLWSVAREHHGGGALMKLAR
jgi:hypothetical protein